MIILAVAIIITLIVVAVMGGIPGIGTGSRSGASSAYWKTAKIAITAYSFADAAGTDGKLIIRNNQIDTIRITAIDISDKGSDEANVSFMSSGSTFGPGEEKIFTADLDTGSPCNSLSAGDSYTINVEIIYTDDETGATYNFTGDGNKLEGQCASSIS